jgi:methionyl-tRNA formyltransferase
MRIIFFGTPAFVTPILQSLIRHFTVEAIITAPDKKAGRKQLMTPSPIKAFATSDKVHLPVFTPSKFDDEMLKQIRALQPDLLVVAAYGYILPKKVLDLAPFGAINIHPSLLPKYRGATPVPSTLLSEDTTTGVTILKMDEEMDHGPIITMRSYPIHETDTTQTLLTHLFNLGAEILHETITSYTNGKIEPTAQDDSKATYTKKIAKDDGMIDMENLPEKTQLDRMIRAYFPWPTVWTKIKIQDKDVRIKFLPGGKVQMEGKNSVTMKDFINGYPKLKSLFEKLG